MRDHDARVRHFGQAFVSSVTHSLDDYRSAVAYTLRHFGSRAAEPRFASGGLPRPSYGKL
jgi:hypothetical protein